jgi:hypothetical protein
VKNFQHADFADLCRLVLWKICFYQRFALANPFHPHTIDNVLLS